MTNKSIAQAAGIIAVAGLLSRILGFLRDALISGFYGPGYIVDSYTAAFVFPDLMYSLLVVVALSSAFIPVILGQMLL